MDAGETLACHDRLSEEIFEIYIILLPFDRFIEALESHACALLDIVPLFREPATILPMISSF
jgi:hypothetical protein